MYTWHTGDLVADGIKIHYHRSGGAKRPVVLAHGLTDNALCYARLAAALEQEYDVVTFDARGHGQSDAPEDGYSYDDRAADLAGLVGALHLEKPALIGHSMGAATAAVAAANYPELARCIVAEDPPWREDFFAPTPEQQRATAEMWRTNLTGYQSKTRDELLAWCLKERRWPEDDCRPWAEAKLQVNLNVLKGFAASRTPWQQVVRRIRCPILLITGDPALGAIMRPEDAAEAASLWHSGRVVNIPGASHNIRRDQFEPALLAIMTFLREQK
jgi:pimeloyl-ACP methyl ester carboxylesterase